MTRLEFIKLFRENAAHTVFPEIHDGWVARNHSTTAKATAFAAMLQEEITLEWLRKFAQEVHDSASRNLQSKEDPACRYEPETMGQRVRTVTDLTTIFLNTLNTIRGVRDVVTVCIPRLTPAHMSKYLGADDYESSAELPLMKLEDCSDMPVNHPSNTVVLIGTKTPMKSDVFAEELFRCNYKVLANLTVEEPVDPEVFSSSIRKYDPAQIILRYNHVKASTGHQVRVVLRRLFSEYQPVKRTINVQDVLCFRRRSLQKTGLAEQLQSSVA